MTVINQRIINYIRDLKPEEAQELVKLLPAKLMSDELARREDLKSNQLCYIAKILEAR